MAFKIDIIGDIEGFWGIDYSTIQSQLDRANGEDVEIRLHSGGGSVIEGFAIRNALANYKGNVTVHIIGLAASIASIIPTGANEVTIQDGAFIMIHKATLWSSEPMNDEQLSNTSKTLEMFGDSLISTYTASAKKNGKLINNSEEETKTNFEKLVAAETWLNAQQAVDLGLATRVVETQGEALTNRFTNTLSNYNHIPTEIKNLYMPQEEEEKISISAFKAIAQSFASLFKNKEVEAVEENATVEDAPINNEEENQEMTHEEMQAELESNGFTVTAKAVETETHVTKENEEMKVLKETVAAMQTTIKAFEAKLAKPTGGETPTNGNDANAKTDLQKAIEAQVKNK